MQSGAILIHPSTGVTTQKVVEATARRLRFPIKTASPSAAPDLSAHDLVLFFCPTYGDEEMQLEMEDYLRMLKASPRRFVVCETGNYYGYDEPDFGAGRIIRRELIARGWHEAHAMLSLDALPTVDWQALETWVDSLSASLAR